jgi:CubicO group peptidase (beta-lactamase class C family)
VFSAPFIRTARIPAAGLHSTAGELATVFQMLLQNGEYNGVRLLKPETVISATTSGYQGWDDYIQTKMNWGYGFIMGSSEYAPGDLELSSMGHGCKDCTFGAFGMGTSMVWADRDSRLVVAFTCNGMLDNESAKRRWTALSNAVWDAVKEG